MAQGDKTVAFPSGVGVLNKKHLDARQGPEAGYTNVADAVASIPAGQRVKGLTVFIQNGSSVDEYWWRDGTTDADLVKKNDGGKVFVLDLTNSETLSDLVGKIEPYSILVIKFDSTDRTIAQGTYDLKGAHIILQPVSSADVLIYVEDDTVLQNVSSVRAVGAYVVSLRDNGGTDQPKINPQKDHFILGASVDLNYEIEFTTSFGVIINEGQGEVSYLSSSAVGGTEVHVYSPFFRRTYSNYDGATVSLTRHFAALSGKSTYTHSAAGAESVSFLHVKQVEITLEANINTSFDVNNVAEDADVELIIIQDATGGRTVDWSVLDFGAGTTITSKDSTWPVIDSAANAKTKVNIQRRGTAYHLTSENIGTP